MRIRIPQNVALRMAWLWDIAKPGRLAGKLARFLVAGIILAHAALIVCVLFASIALSRWNPPVTALMVYRQVTVHQKSRPIRFVPLRQIPRVARDMMVRLEDFKFYRHAGIDLGAIRDAYNLNRALGYTLYGGSTIPQQLARNLFLTPRKTYLRKYLEAIIAVEMDLLLSKNRLLELYLNCIEWGKGVYGIGAASTYYYRTGVGNLSLDEMRRLVTIITNPLKYDVNTYPRSRQMAERYRYLVSRFPDPPAETVDSGQVDTMDGGQATTPPPPE
jgi:monofunctional biosynthetic peptidoglycan transglycosylase